MTVVSVTARFHACGVSVLRLTTSRDSRSTRHKYSSTGSSRRPNDSFRMRRPAMGQGRAQFVMRSEEWVHSLGHRATRRVLFSLG
jgi:hypothetical protein